MLFFVNNSLLFSLIIDTHEKTADNNQSVYNGNCA